MCPERGLKCSNGVVGLKNDSSGDGDGGVARDSLSRSGTISDTISELIGTVPIALWECCLPVHTLSLVCMIPGAKTFNMGYCSVCISTVVCLYV